MCDGFFETDVRNEKVAIFSNTSTGSGTPAIEFSEMVLFMHIKVEKINKIKPISYL